MIIDDKVSLIRRGNELFNNGDIKNALKIFLSVNYIDGIIRVADYLYHKKGEKLSALKLYKKINYQSGINKFAIDAAEMIKFLLNEDKKYSTKEEKSNIKEAEYVPDDELKKQKEDIKNEFMKKWKPVVINSNDLKKI